MKAPKYVALTDHTAGHNLDDRTYELEATNVVDAMDEVIKLVGDDNEHLYCVVIYERVKGCKGARDITYLPILRAGKDAQCFTPYRETGFCLSRETYRSTCWYHVCEYIA